MTRTNVFISFSYEDENIDLVKKIKKDLENSGSIVDFSEKKDRSQFSNNTIWENLLSRIHGSSVTLVVLTKDLLSSNRYKISSGNNFVDSGWVYREISASLRNWKNNAINGVLVVYDDEISHILQSRNFKVAKIIDRNRNNKANRTGNYIEMIPYSKFKTNPSLWISETKDKRKSQINNNEYYIKYDFHN